MDTSKIMREVVHERFCGEVVSSDLLSVTPEEVAQAEENYKEKGECDHSLVIDTPGWLYDTRKCAICGVGLGTV